MGSLPAYRRSAPLVPALLALGLAACADPRGSYDDFAGRLPVQRKGELPDAGAFDALPDVSGRFLVGLFTGLGTGKPTESVAEVAMTRTPSGGMLTVQLQPLGIRDRAPVGAPGERTSVAVDSHGRFEVVLANVHMPGTANPITGQDFTIDAKLRGLIRSEDHFCGLLDGRVTEPQVVDLTGSTFGAVRIGPAGVLPDPIAECVEPDEVPAAP